MMSNLIIKATEITKERNENHDGCWPPCHAAALGAPSVIGTCISTGPPSSAGPISMMMALNSALHLSIKGHSLWRTTRDNTALLITATYPELYEAPACTPIPGPHNRNLLVGRGITREERWRNRGKRSGRKRREESKRIRQLRSPFDARLNGSLER